MLPSRSRGLLQMFSGRFTSVYFLVGPRVSTKWLNLLRFAQIFFANFSDFGTNLRNCAKLEFRKKRNGAILREMTFANDCANCCFFRAKKEKFCVSFRKDCAKVLRMETLVGPGDYYS